MFLQEKIAYEERSDPCLMKYCIESVFVECQCNNQNKSVIHGCVYRPPNTPISEFLGELTILLDIIIVKERKICYISGDFNIDILKHETHAQTQSFIDLVLSYSLFPMINRPTRVTNTTTSIIDNIFTNNMK